MFAQMGFGGAGSGTRTLVTVVIVVLVVGALPDVVEDQSDDAAEPSRVRFSVKHASLEEAIRKMTSMPAAHFGLWDRGLLRAGYAADVVVFDYDGLDEVSTVDDPHHYARGVEHVLVNGTLNGAQEYFSWFQYEFWRFVFVQEEVAKLAMTAVQYPPMQKGASFNLEAVKEKIEAAMAK